MVSDFKYLDVKFSDRKNRDHLISVCFTSGADDATRTHTGLPTAA